MGEARDETRLAKFCRFLPPGVRSISASPAREHFDEFILAFFVNNKAQRLRTARLSERDSFFVDKSRKAIQDAEI